MKRVLLNSRLRVFGSVAKNVPRRFLGGKRASRVRWMVTNVAQTTTLLPERVTENSRTTVKTRPANDFRQIAYTPPPQKPPPPPENQEKPGILDAQRFELHPSVEFWETFNFSKTMQDASPGVDRWRFALQKAMNAIRKEIDPTDVQSMAYWAYHIGRSTFFSVNGFASLGLHNYRSRDDEKQSAGSSGYMSNLMEGRWIGLWAEALAMFQQDLRNIKSKEYKLPWDMANLSHRQYNPLYIAMKSAQFLEDAMGVLTRRYAKNKKPVWLQSEMYPSYYLDTRHYQTEGWLSPQSAKNYEFSTETLFIGRQDAMQRQTLVPISRHMRGRNPEGMKMMDMACGTGRFLTFVKDNYPAMEVTAVDLSPYYLTEARSNMQYWKKTTQGTAADLGGVDGTGAQFVQSPAEQTPCESESFDIITCIYLFHEIPREAREGVAREMFRLLKPGGLAVLADSVQYGDRPHTDPTLGNFQYFDEPYHGDYISHDLGEMYEKFGFKCGLKVLGAATKVLAFHKP